MFVNVIGWSKTSGYLSVQLFSTGKLKSMVEEELHGQYPLHRFPVHIQ